MTTYGPNKRSVNRPIREFQITINDSDSQVYTLDFSTHGLRLGGAKLKLLVGERVKITAKQGDKIYNFNGQVKRNDGLLPIRRIGRSVNVFYVMANGSAYQDFFCAMIQNNITNCDTIDQLDGGKGPNT
jgi:hypothetical protein